MKKIIKALLMSAVLFSGMSAFAAGKKSIVCTTFPQYDWVKNIIGENNSAFEITLLQNNGTDLHSYQPSVKDVVKISTSDLFIYVGGESDKWVKNVLADSKNKNQHTINLLELLGDKAKEEEFVEGMQFEEEEGEEPEFDEHVWLSLKNAAFYVNEISSAIMKIDSVNSSLYKNNAELYVKKLLALNEEYKSAVKSAKYKTILVADRFPFRYLTDEYGLKYYAAFNGCSAECEASFETIIFLSKKIDELGINSIITIDKSNKKIARTIISNTKTKNQQILEMDSLQAVTKQELQNGRNYFSVMKKNLEALKTALN